MSTLSPSPLTRTLVRVLLALTATSGLLSASRSVNAAPRPNIASECYAMTGVDVYYRNDAAAPYSPARRIRHGSLGPGETAFFEVMATTDDVRFHRPVTDAKRSIRARMVSPPGGALVTGRIGYSTAPGNYLYFRPEDVTAGDRVALLEISFQCQDTLYSWKYVAEPFVLILRGSGSPAPENAPFANAALDLGQSPQLEGSGSDPVDLAVSVSGPEEPVLQGESFSGTIRVKNVGETVSRYGKIEIPGFWQATYTHSQGGVGMGRDHWASWQEFQPGTLLPGQEATLTIVAPAYRPGAWAISARVRFESNDVNPANNTASTTFNVVSTTPDLAGTWSGTDFGILTRGVNHTRMGFRGSLTVINRGSRDSAGTRVLMLLRGQRGQEPHFHVLGFRDLPPIPAGGTENIEIQESLRLPPYPRDPQLVAILDATGLQPEESEVNNMVTSAVLHHRVAR